MPSIAIAFHHRVLLPLYSNTWRERIVVPARGLKPLPAEADVKQLAMLRINPPAAALMLSEYVDLMPGDWVVQNAANSGVGRAVIAIGKERGIRTINLVPGMTSFQRLSRLVAISFSKTTVTQSAGSLRLSVMQRSADRALPDEQYQRGLRPT